MIERASSPSAASVADSRSRASAVSPLFVLTPTQPGGQRQGVPVVAGEERTGSPRARRSARCCRRRRRPAARRAPAPVGGRPRTAQPATSGMARRAMSRPGNGLVRAMRATRMPQHVQMRTRGRWLGRGARGRDGRQATGVMADQRRYPRPRGHPGTTPGRRDREWRMTGGRYRCHTRPACCRAARGRTRCGWAWARRPRRRWRPRCRPRPGAAGTHRLARLGRRRARCRRGRCRRGGALPGLASA